MSAANAISIRRSGLVTSVGLSAPAACAAFRARLTNPRETEFINSSGERIIGHEVLLEEAWRGIGKLTRMAEMVINEALVEVPRAQWTSLPLILCIAERDRPGRLQDLDQRLLLDVEEALGTSFSADSAVISHGRVGTAIALDWARKLLYEHKYPLVLIVAVDSLLVWPTLRHYERNDRLLSERNSNGFIPGEGACALLMSKPRGGADLLCTGVGFGSEPAHIESEAPQRAEGLTTAIRSALRDAGCEMHDLDYRITDVSGEQYYFKEAALALARTLRKVKESFDLWHPAEFTGEAGALSGASLVAVASMAFKKGYAPGQGVLAHMGNDAGERAAVVLRGLES